MKKTLSILLTLALAIGTASPAFSAATTVTKGSSAAAAEVPRGSAGDDLQGQYEARYTWYGPFTFAASGSLALPVTISSTVLQGYGVASTYSGPVRVQAWPGDGMTFSYSPSTITPTVLGRPIAANYWLDSGNLKIGNRVWFQGTTGPASVRYVIGILE